MHRSGYEVLEREVPSQESIGALNAALRHEEEIEKYIERNLLSIGDASMYIWSRGSQGQKVGMIRQLEKNAPEMDERALTQLLLELKDAMWSQDLEIQLATSEVMCKLLADFSEMQQLTVLGMCSAMLSVSSSDVRAGWVGTVMELVRILPVPLLLSEIVPLLHKKSEHSEPGDQRVLSTQLIGSLCKRLDAATVISTILPKALGLCQDTDIKVRAAMCHQLFSISQAVGVQVSKEKVTPELFELLDDEDRHVTRAAFSCLIDMVDFFDIPYRKEHFYPIIRTYLQSPPASVQLLLATDFGRFLLKIQSDIEGTDDVNLCAAFYKQAATNQDPEVRRCAAFNLPAVVKCLPPSTYAPYLYHATRVMAGDSHTPVRRAVAAGLHEVIELLGDKAALFIKDPFSMLIQDPENEVRQFIMQNLAAHMALFASQLRGEDKDSFFGGIVGGIVSYTQFYERRDWRKMDALFSAMTSFPNYFSPTVLNDRFIPILFSYIRNGATSLRRKCCELLVLFAKRLPTQLIVDVYNRIHAELRRSNTCYHRSAYLVIVMFSVEHFSRRFVRERCLEFVAEIAKDPTSVVRAELARILPAYRRALRGCGDPQLNDSFSSAAQRLMMDEDELVRSYTRESMECVKSMESDWARSLRTGDMEDSTKESQEGSLTDFIREQKTNERRQKLKELLRENELEGPLRRVPSIQSKPSMARVPTGGHAVPAAKYTPVGSAKSPSSSSSNLSKYGTVSSNSVSPSSRSKSSTAGAGALLGRPKR